MKFKNKIILTLVVAISATLFSFSDPFFDLQKNVELYISVLKNLHIYYVDKTDDPKLIKNSIDAMLKGLDPYTVFYPESDIEDYRFMTTGEYGGIGAGVVRIDGKFIVTEPVEGFAAHKADMRAGDELIKIEGQILKDKSMEEAGKMMKGRPSTAVRLLLKRNGKTFEKLVVREKISVKNVPYFTLIDGKYGYIKHTGFTETASKEVREALTKLKEQGAESLILDLRGNPGGLLAEAVNCVNIFVPKGKLVVDTRGKIKEWNRSIKTKNKATDLDIPVVALINSSSASAAEIVSGALQDYDRAVVVGRRSFGKGLVQTTLDLAYNTKMKVTTAKYYIPSGRCIQALDYSNRRADGSVGKVPDSLVTQFETMNGRKVYDGGGVMPDIEVKKMKLSSFTENLFDNKLFFKFANNYRNKHDSIGNYMKYTVSQATMNAFKSFIKQSGTQYETRSIKALEAFKKTVGDEQYNTLLKAELAAIEKKLQPNIDKDFGLYQEQIRWILKEEIVARYGLQTGRIEASLLHDPDVAKAKEILEDKQKYQAVLEK